MDRYETVIIGGGASGLMLYNLLKKKSIIVEANDRVGKKLLATGNGKCNLSNDNLNASFYNAPDFVRPIIGEFGFEEIVKTFKSFGLVTKTIEGRLYPYSECAATVLNVLRKNVNALTAHKVMDVIKTDFGFTVKAAGENGISIDCKNVVLASGSNATFGLNSLNLYSKFGHTVKEFKPSLCPIKVDGSDIKGLSGVRVKAALKCGDHIENGEILFKDNAISGIAAFNVSAIIARGGCKNLAIDFMPDYTLNDVAKLVKGGIEGIFHTRLCELLKSRTKGSLAEIIKNYELTFKGLSDISAAQVASGGLNTDEFDNNLMSKKISGLYAIGEALDVDGICGGYNLSWAFSSAAKVAKIINAT